MALSEELPLYKDCLSLLNRIIPLTKDLPRFFRYGIGIRMVDLNLEMISLIYQANGSYEKLKSLEDFLNKYRMLVILFRVCVEQKVITERQYAGFAILIDKIGRQGTRWKQYNEKAKDRKQ